MGSMEVLDYADLALVVVDNRGVSEYETEILRICRENKLPFVLVINKVDEDPGDSGLQRTVLEKFQTKPILVSAKNGLGISELKAEIIRCAPKVWEGNSIVGDLIGPGDLAVLVVPIDSAAPKGRLILPQVQTIRDILDHGGQAFVVRESELQAGFSALQTKPKLVVTDSQVFAKVSTLTPEDVPLTSFSILFARYKGDLDSLTAGAYAMESLKPGDKVLIAEACTHHRQEDDRERGCQR